MASRGVMVKISGFCVRCVGSGGADEPAISSWKRRSTRIRSEAACWSIITSSCGKEVPEVEVPSILIRMYFWSTCEITVAVRRPALVSFPRRWKVLLLNGSETP